LAAKLGDKRVAARQRQFALQRGAHFGTFNDVRMIVASMVLLAGVSAVSAQEQERKLVDRILRPNMSLVNSAQNKQFGVSEISVAKRARPKSYYTPDRSLGKSFAAGRAFPSRQFAARHFGAGDTAANISPRSHVTKTDPVRVAAAASGSRIAPENGTSLPAAPFAGNRPFLGRGKSQEALSARDTPLTIEQVRELLNKNK
jgi:hypothetical protein